MQIGYTEGQQNAGHHVHQRYLGLEFPSKKRMRNSAKRSPQKNLFQIIVANRHPNIFFLAQTKNRSPIFLNPNWLVASTQLKNISQIGSFPQVGMKIKNIWNHHPAFFWETSRPHPPDNNFPQLHRTSSRKLPARCPDKNLHQTYGVLVVHLPTTCWKDMPLSKGARSCWWGLF